MIARTCAPRGAPAFGGLRRGKPEMSRKPLERVLEFGLGSRL